jgi:hypothetical protein
MRQVEVIEAIQQLIRGDANTRATIVKLFPLALRFFLTRYPSYDLAIEWNGTADGADYIWCPDDFQWPLLVWTAKISEPVTVISPREFAELKARNYSSSKIFCTVMLTRQGRKKLVFIDDIGAGTRVDVWYYQKPTLISIDMVPDYYADGMIAWIRKQMAPRDIQGAEYIVASTDLKAAVSDLNAMSQANPAAEIIGRIPSNWRR